MALWCLFVATTFSAAIEPVLGVIVFGLGFLLLIVHPL